MTRGGVPGDKSLHSNRIQAEKYPIAESCEDRFGREAGGLAVSFDFRSNCRRDSKSRVRTSGPSKRWLTRLDRARINFCREDQASYFGRISTMIGMRGESIFSR